MPRPAPRCPAIPSRSPGRPPTPPACPSTRPTPNSARVCSSSAATVYAAFASDCDYTPYRGIVVGVSTTTHAVTTMWSDESGIGTDQNSQAGIWQSGAGLVSLGPGNIVLATGNGVSPQPAASGHPPATLSESVIGLTVGSNGDAHPDPVLRAVRTRPTSTPTTTTSGRAVRSPSRPPYFGTPAHPQLLVQVGKDGRIFLLDAADMGGFQQGAAGGDAVLQELGPYGGVWGHPAVYGGQGGWVYVLESAGGGYLRALSYGVDAQGVPQLTSAGTSSGSFGYTSGSPMVTSNGTTAGQRRGLGRLQQRTERGPGPAAGLRRHPVERCPPPAVVGAHRHGLEVRRAHRLERPHPRRHPPGTPDRVRDVDQDGGDRLAGGLRLGPRRLDPHRHPDGDRAPGHDRDRPGDGQRLPGHRQPGGGARPDHHDLDDHAGRSHGGTHDDPAGRHRAGTGRRLHRLVTARRAPGSAAGARVPVRVTFTPTGPGAVIADVSLPTTVGDQTVPLSGYGTAPGLLHSSEPLSFGTVLTGSGGQGPHGHGVQLLEPARDHHRRRRFRAVPSR